MHRKVTLHCFHQHYPLQTCKHPVQNVTEGLIKNMLTSVTKHESELTLKGLSLYLVIRHYDDRSTCHLMFSQEISQIGEKSRWR